MSVKSLGALVYLLGSAAAVGQQAGSPAVGPVPLWRTLQVGMTPEQVANAVTQFEGVKSAKVKTKKGRPSDVDISYIGFGVPLGDYKVYLIPKFSSDTLEEITLKTSLCLSNGRVFSEGLDKSLSEKYGTGQSVRFQNERGVQIDQGMTYSNGKTRVVLTSKNIPAVEPSPPSRGQTDLSYPMRMMNYRRNMQECSRDNGTRVVLEIRYGSEGSFRSRLNEAQGSQEARDQALKDGL